METITRRPPEWALALRNPPEQASITPRTMRRAAALARGEPRLVKTAKRAGVDITPLGIVPLPDEPIAWAGAQTDWILRRAVGASDAIMPRIQADKLVRLVHAGIDFPEVYVAHETPKGLLDLPVATTGPGSWQPVRIDHAAAARAVGAVPPHPGTRALAERLDLSAQRLKTVLRAALPVAGAIAAAPLVIAAAPFVAAGAVLAGLDPVIFGVVPAGDPVPGQPAAWYVLAAWMWPGTPGPRQHKPMASGPL